MNEIVQKLQEVRTLCVKAYTTDIDQRQRTVMILVVDRLEELKADKDAELISIIDKYILSINEVLAEFPGKAPHDSTLIKEAQDRMKRTMPSFLIPDLFGDEFAQYRVVYATYNAFIQEILVAIESSLSGRNDLAMIRNLQRVARNFLVDNPNFKGASPYYKRHFDEMFKEQESWCEFLCQHVDNCIEYFSEEC